jgi:SIR2-like domain
LMPREHEKFELPDSGELADNHWLSFTSQSYLKALFHDIVDTSQPLTLITGAGISIDAGLPDWTDLLERIIEKFDQDEVKDLARAFQADPLRQAEFILQLAMRGNVNSEEHEFIRDGLYPKSSIARPGPLAESLARLVAARASEIRIVTTNFDLLFDEALTTQLHTSHVEPYGLREYDEWVKHRTVRDVGVLHVHGALRQGEDPIKPVILTQSHYLKDGALVRQHIANALTEETKSVGLFVGLSLTDPNLLGPLYETVPPNESDPVPRRYALTVADFDNDAAEKSSMLAVESVRFLDEKLKLRPVLARSYSQVIQIIDDLALALLEPARYSTSRKHTSDDLRYGIRLRNAVEYCYETLGCSRRPYVPTGEAASKITDQLRQALSARNGPHQLLRKWASSHKMKNFPDGEPERYGLHLWLRALDKHVKSPTYSLFLIGSSTIENKDPWYSFRNVPITRPTDYAAAEAVFSGRKIVLNMGPRRTTRVWRGSLAIPIVLRGFGSTKTLRGELVDRITVGALTLTSTRYVADPSVEETKLDPSMTDNMSVIARLTPEELVRLYDSLERAATALLSPRDSTSGHSA